MNTIEIVTLIGIGLTFVIGIFNLIVTLRTVRKTSFINSITASRIKYIQELRQSISKFCALANTYNLRLQDPSPDQIWELHKESDHLKYIIRLYLNPIDTYWDKEIIKLTDEIMQRTDKDPSEPIEKLIKITQHLLKLEWEGAKRESEDGILNEPEKRALYEKHVRLHQMDSEEPNFP